MKKDVDPKSVK